MDKIFSNLDQKKFKQISIVLLILCDVLICTYLYQKIALDRQVFNASVEIILKAQPGAEQQLPADFRDQLYTLMINALLTLLTLYMLYHFFVYYLWHVDKKTAGKYIKMVSWVGGPLACFFGLANLIRSPLHALMAIVAGVFYLFVAFGLSYYPDVVINRKAVK